MAELPEISDVETYNKKYVKFYIITNNNVTGKILSNIEKC